MSKNKILWTVEYKTTTDGVSTSHTNGVGWHELEDCRKWCARNGAKSFDGEMTYSWMEGDTLHEYIIHPVEYQEG